MELPNVKESHIGLAIILGLTLIITSWIFFGYQTMQISKVQEQSMFSTVLVAAIMTASKEDRALAVEAVCPEKSAALNTSMAPEPTPEEALCKVLQKVFTASSADEATKILEDVKQSTEGTK